MLAGSMNVATFSELSIDHATLISLPFCAIWQQKPLISVTPLTATTTSLSLRGDTAFKVFLFHNV